MEVVNERVNNPRTSPSFFLSLTAGLCYGIAWNNLPKCLKNALSVNNFKLIIKKVADLSDSHGTIM